MLEDVKHDVLAGKMPEATWLLFRLVHFPSLDEDAAKDALLEWAEENRIEATMFTRKVNEHDVVFVMFSAR